MQCEKCGRTMKFKEVEPGNEPGSALHQFVCSGCGFTKHPCSQCFLANWEKLRTNRIMGNPTGSGCHRPHPMMRRHRHTKRMRMCFVSWPSKRETREMFAEAGMPDPYAEDEE